ncbi:MAG: hypothetical protein MZV49_01875 [Rhodopseudomonas palustris]|nr:hypothetical protein [Rhodopseudomonas palustris]
MDMVSLAAFSVEYYVRVWIAPEHPLYRQMSAFNACKAYIFSAQGIRRFLHRGAAVGGAGQSGRSAGAGDPCAARSEIRPLFVWYAWLLLEVLESERRALLACLVILLCATWVSATAMHLVEGQIQPDKFGSIPEGMWWAVAC